LSMSDNKQMSIGQGGYLKNNLAQAQAQGKHQG
jgi:hypothetical protein